MVALDFPAPYVNCRAIGGVNGSHEDLCREQTTLHNRLCVGNYEGIDLVHADILYVDVAHQPVQHFAFGVTHVVLQFGQQGYCCRSGHTFEHIFLPVFAFDSAFGGNFGVQVALDDAALSLVGYHLGDSLTITVHCLVELLTATLVGCQHHTACSLQVLLILDVVYIAFLAVALLHDCHLQFLGQVIQRVAHLTHIFRLVIPLLHLRRVGLHLLLEVLVDTFVGLDGILCGQLYTVGNNGKSLQYVTADVEGQHGHQHDVHQIDHLLTWRYLLFLYLSHLFLMDN